MYDKCRVKGCVDMCGEQRGGCVESREVDV